MLRTGWGRGDNDKKKVLSDSKRLLIKLQISSSPPWGSSCPQYSPSFIAWPPVQACFQEGREAAILCRETTGPNTNSYMWNSWEELPSNLLNLVTGPKL